MYKYHMYFQKFIFLNTPLPHLMKVLVKCTRGFSLNNVPINRIIGSFEHCPRIAEILI